MIKLNWYVLTKPHVVARYYRIKRRPTSIGSKFYHSSCCIHLHLPNKDIDRSIYEAFKECLHEQMPTSKSIEDIRIVIEVLQFACSKTTITLDVEWLNTKLN